MKNSLKQMFRTPVKCFVLIISLAVTIMLLIIGSNLLLDTDKNWIL